MHLKVERFLLPKLNQLFLATNKTGTATYSKPYFIIRLLLLRERILIHEILLGHIYHVEKIQGNRILPHTHTLSPSSPPLPPTPTAPSLLHGQAHLDYINFQDGFQY